jgi:hypothetical protein
MQSQALVTHMYVCQPVKQSKPQRSSKPARPEPAQTDTTWLPGDAVRVSSTISGYAFGPPVHASNPKLGLMRILGASASPAVQTVAAHVYRYLRRAFTLWPGGQSKDALVEVLDLWLVVCFPWKAQDPSARCATCFCGRKT